MLKTVYVCLLKGVKHPQSAVKDFIAARIEENNSGSDMEPIILKINKTPELIDLKNLIFAATGSASSKSPLGVEGLSNMCLCIITNTGFLPFKNNIEGHNLRDDIAKALSCFQSVDICAMPPFKFKIMHVPYFAAIGDIVTKKYKPLCVLRLITYNGDKIQSYDIRKKPDWLKKRSRSITKSRGLLEDAPKDTPEKSTAVNTVAAPSIQDIDNLKKLCDFFVVGSCNQITKSISFYGISEHDALKAFGAFCEANMLRNAFLINTQTESVIASCDLRPFIRVK